VVTAGLVPLLPLIGAAVLIFVPALKRRVAGYVATSAAGGAFVFALMAFGDLMNRPVSRRLLVRPAYDWITDGNLPVPHEFRIDPLSVTMILVVTGVGTLIHAYSIGYMHGDPREGTYFAYLNLFLSSMLILVLANNFLVLYVGWELVGLCSYLLISFWRHNPVAAAAGKKAFIVNRIGDFGFLIGLLLIFNTFGSLDFDKVFAAAGSAGSKTALAAIPILLFIGACGKSAQFPLHVWLPDAMEGPTPVSALIHAATMVTAGVYLVARAHVLFEVVPAAGWVVVLIGTFTALLAATMAVVQDDIKRVLAYSTVSQLGYMFLAVGVGALTRSPLAYAAGIFHLVTHAFFKALLFLGAGSVMHGVNNETSMLKMGGLIRALPITGSVFVIGWLAISGIPPLSGFFSKDAILLVTWEAGLVGLWAVAVATAGITAFYMSRQVFLVFFGDSRVPDDVHPHESPPVMTMPLRVLAALAALGGGLGLSVQAGAVGRFLRPVFEEGAGEGHAERAGAFAVPELVLAMFTLAVAAVAIAFAYRLYLGPDATERREALKQRFKAFLEVLRHKYYIDDFYNAVFVQPGKAFGRFLARQIDAGVIDGAVNGVGTLVVVAAGRLRRVQTGLVRRYVVAMLGGALLVLTMFLVRFR
jgi:NADH-quinone oxidoreductase subunit L